MALDKVTTIMAVLVVYERDLQQIDAWPWLMAALNAKNRAGFKLEHVLVYDNSCIPKAQAAAGNSNCGYVHDRSNGGTAAAYERALGVAMERHMEWLLLVDQDTDLPQDFLDAAAASLSKVSSEGLAALVPWVICQGKVVSPARVTLLGSIRPLRRSGVFGHVAGLTAVASGSLIRVAALRQVLPFPRELWLDYVDHWLFAQINLRGAGIAVFDGVLRHALSVMTPTQLSRRRLNSILDGESYFQGLLGPLARLVYPLRLLGRLVRYALISPRMAVNVVKWMIGEGRRAKC
jgi:hypothetical protein